MRIPLLILFLVRISLLGLGQPGLQSGLMTIRQIDLQEVEVDVDLYFDLDGIYLDSIIYAWDDAKFTPVVYSEIILDEHRELRLVKFESKYVFPSNGQHTIGIETCCWSSSLANLDVDSQRIFSLTNRINLPSVQFSEAYESPEILSNINIYSGSVGQPFMSPIEFEQGTGDSVSFKLIQPAEEGYIFPPQVYGSPPNEFMITSNGELRWDSPQVPGIYSYGVKIEEYLEGELMQEFIYYGTININLTTNQDERSIEHPRLLGNPGDGSIALSKSVSLIRIFDANGHLVRANHDTKSIDIRAVNSGVYYVEFSDVKTNRRFVEKYIKW